MVEGSAAGDGRVLIPATWSQLNRHCRATAAKPATFSQSITIASNNLPGEPGSVSSTPKEEGREMGRAVTATPG